ncbi:hypothetical protein ACFVT5_17595 [Streptomyces sp. NPDC058001]|uniref:hypothetical protein n=1 Tax=Streptomyces sp. NPDC058001 TaxID=3346300 RepID=UPI0036E62929
MSTTRHHINRRRRLEANSTRGERDAGGTALTTAAPPAETKPTPKSVPRPTLKSLPKATPKSVPKATTSVPKPKPAPRTGRRHVALLAGLCLLTLLLGAFAGWARAEVSALRDRPALRNTALTDPARTSEIKGQVSRAVGGVFSYDYANPGTSEKAAATYLTGKAVEQHRTLVSGVIAQAKKQKAVITTTVTDSAVERIDGDRARVLVFADQSSTGTSAKAQEPTYAGAMFAVDLLRKDGHWLISGIDTFGS